MRFKISLIAFILAFSVTAQADFNFLLKHPNAAAQSTSAGKKIHTIKSYNGSLYLGYGDYGANTGPINICRITPPNNSIVCEFTLSTEQIDRYRILNNKLYAVATDPSNPNQHAYAVKNRAAAWQGVSRNIMSQGSIMPAHIFDMIEHDRKLWAVGSQHSSAEMNVPPFTNNGDATVWVSADGGTTWNVSLDIQQIDNCCARFYFSGVVNNKLYVQAVDYDEIHPSSRVFNGTSWTVGANILTYGLAQKANTFLNQMVMIQSGSLVSFDGTTTILRYNDIVDYTIHTDRIYVLTSNGQVHSSSTLDHWRFEDEFTANEIPISIEVLNEVIYVGTHNSNIYSARIQAKNLNIIPILQLLLLDD